MRIFIFIVLVFLFLPLQAQYFGGFSPKIKWMQIETQQARIIFPAGYSAQANRVASDIDYLIKTQQGKLDFKLRKIDIVLNNQAVESNGYVAPMPYHSMYYLTPPQDANGLGTQHWLDGLAIHEYRHVWQMNQMRGGLGNLTSVIWGDQGWAGLQDMIFPPWYFEGDAVLSETTYSTSGRGRVPYFSLTERAMALDRIHYKYVKVRNGSYVDALPNHYQYGYHMVAYGQKRYGLDFWPKVIKNARNLQGIFYPFSRAIRKETGMGIRAFYDSTQMDISNDALFHAADCKVTPSQTITPAKKTVTNYYQSVFETDSTLLVMRNSFKEILSLYRVHIKTGKETKICDVGYIDNPWFSYSKGFVVWSEFRHDPRYWNTGYSVVRKLDVRTKVAKDLTQNTHYFSPALSPDGKKIAVVEYSPEQQCRIKILDPKNGKELFFSQALNCFGDSLFASSPAFSEDGNRLVFILKKVDKLAFFQYDFTLDSVTQLSDFTAHTLSHPTVKGNRIYFSSSMGGKDDIFYLQSDDKSIHHVILSRLGAYYPAISPDNKELVFSNYSLQGFNLQLVSLPDQNIQTSNWRKPVNEDFYGWEAYPAPFNLTDSVQAKAYEVKKYERTNHMLNFHSWGPTADGDFAGVEIMSDNVLNNTSVLGGVYYNYNNDYTYGQVMAYYGGLYPVFYGGYTNLFDKRLDLQIVEGGCMLPFDFSTIVYTRAFLMQGGYMQQQNIYDQTDSYTFRGLHANLSYHNYKYPAFQQVGSIRGLAVSLDIKKGELDNFYSINETVLKSEIYLPGLAKTHAIKVEFDHKGIANKMDGFFLDDMDYARGYNRPDSAYNSYSKFAFNYHFPLAYPEVGINGVFYLKRIRMNLFADFGSASLITWLGFSTNKDYRSVGAELYFDLKWFNSLDMPIFVRYSHCLDDTNKTTPWQVGLPLVTF